MLSPLRDAALVMLLALVVVVLLPAFAYYAIRRIVGRAQLSASARALEDSGYRKDRVIGEARRRHGPVPAARKAPARRDFARTASPQLRLSR